MINLFKFINTEWQKSVPCVGYIYKKGNEILVCDTFTLYREQSDEYNFPTLEIHGKEGRYYGNEDDNYYSVCVKFCKDYFSDRELGDIKDTLKDGKPRKWEGVIPYAEFFNAMEAYKKLKKTESVLAKASTVVYLKVRDFFFDIKIVEKYLYFCKEKGKVDCFYHTRARKIRDKETQSTKTELGAICKAELLDGLFGSSVLFMFASRVLTEKPSGCYGYIDNGKLVVL